MADDGVSNRSQRPLAGVVICCTSILPEKRSELATIAIQMGAEQNLDLTSDVTHLIVGDTNTPKYKYVAKEREDVKILGLDWVYAVRESWMEGGDTDVEALERQYKLPTFEGLSICLTGFDDLAFRTRLQNEIMRNGGHYTGDLTKSVTHLIARVPEGKKYTFAGQWNIKIVSLKWFNASLERGMVLEESLYHPTTPEREQGIGAWNRASPKLQNTGKRIREEEPVFNPVRKLRRTASARLGSQNEGIWTDIVGGGFGAQPQQTKQWDDVADTIEPPIRPGSIVMEPKPLSSDATVAERRDVAPMVDDPLPSDDSHPTSERIFYDRKFYVYGFNDRHSSIAQQHLIENGGHVVQSLSDLQRQQPGECSFLLVPYDLPRDTLPSIKRLEPSPDIVTDLWLHRCLHTKQFVPPEAHPTNTLFPAFPIQGFEKLRINSTGFYSNLGIELHQLAKTVRLMGATYEDDLIPQTSVLICDPQSARNEKVLFALEKRIPIVSVEWLWDSSQETRKMPLEKYRIALPQYMIDEARASREDRDKNQDRRTEYNRIAHGHNARKKDPSSSKHRRPPNAESRQSRSTKQPYPPHDSKLDGSQREQQAPVPALPRRSDLLSTDSESASTSKSTSASTSSEALVPTLPLREISTNPPPKALSATLSPSSRKNSPSPQQSHPHPAAGPTPDLTAPTPNQPSNTNNNEPNNTSEANVRRKRDTIASVLSLLSRSKSKASSGKPADESTTNKSGPGPRRRRRSLLGRANSSSSSAKPTAALPISGLSRANSIGSVNSDGLGSVIPSQSQNQNSVTMNAENANSDASLSAAAQILQWQSNAHLPEHLRPDIIEGHGVEEPVLTQLGYENAGSAVNEKRRKKEGKVRDIEGFSSGVASIKSRRTKSRRDGFC